MTRDRRTFLKQLGGGTLIGLSAADLISAKDDRLAALTPRERLGVVTASFTRFLTGPEKKLSLEELPAFMHGEWGLRVVDFNTMNFPSFEPAYLDRLRTAVEKAGCIGTNLKMNQKVDMSSADPEVRAEAMRIYRESIDAAQHLSLRWVRPLPRSETPDMSRHVSAYHELIDYAGERGITVLIENFGWMMDDPDSVVRLAEAVGKDKIAVGLDTGNWTTNEVRYPALTKSYPLAVTCDFKAKEITEDFRHPAYDLEKCFEIGWEAGFRGPWCFEHGHKDWDMCRSNFGWLAEQVREWIKGQS